MNEKKQKSERPPLSDEQVQQEFKTRRNLRSLYSGLAMICFFCLLLVYYATGSRHNALWLIGLIVLAGIAILDAINWRCPACDHRLPNRIRYTFCPYCQSRLREPGTGTISSRQFLVIFLLMFLASLGIFWLLQIVTR